MWYDKFFCVPFLLSGIARRLYFALITVCLALPWNAFADDYSVNFKDTDLKAFIETVGRNLNKTMILGPDIQGVVTIRSVELLDGDQYYQLFLNVLEAQGYAAIELENGTVKVVRSRNAKTEPLPITGDENSTHMGDELITRVVTVRNISVRELAPVLRQLVDSAGSGNVVNYDPSNVIMLTGRASVVNRLVDVIHRMDSTGSKSNEVMLLENASATEVVRVLEGLNKQEANKPSALKYDVVADDRTNSVIINGDPAVREKVKRLIRQLDAETRRSGNSQVFYLKYSKAEELLDVLNQVSGTLKEEKDEGVASPARKSSVSIAASKNSNALVITAPPDMMQSLRDVIEQLDVRRAQVHVEALIVEISEGTTVNFGVQWGNKNSGVVQFSNGNQIPIGALAAARQNANKEDPAADLQTLSEVISGYNGAALGIIRGDWMALLQAVKNDNNANVLSTPSITTLDNEEASFMVGQDVPVLTGSTTGSDNSNPFNTVERKKVGIMLKVTPQINEGNAVQLVIEQEVSKVEGQTNLDVVFAERKLKTTVLADDGELIVLGGLMDEQSGDSVSKVPLLGDIPLLGHFFKSTANKKEKRNLMVFLRPTILRNGMSADGVSQRKYNYMRAEQLAHQQKENDIALLPAAPRQAGYPPELQVLLDMGQKP